MNAFTQDELEGISSALAQKKLSDEKLTKVPLRPPRSYGKVTKIALAPISDSSPLPKQEIEDHSQLEVTIEAIFGKKNLQLKQLESLNIGSVVRLEEGSSELVELQIEGEKIARGELVAIDGHFGIRILSFTKS